jgi:hypothetical protein
MNTDLVFEILDLALSLAEAQVHEASSTDLAIDKTLLEILQKGVTAYKQHAGELLDLSLIKTEDTI